MNVALQMERFWRENGGRPDRPEWIAYVNDFGSLLIDKLVELSEEHNNEGRFGMSKAGGCTRAAALKLLGAASEQLTGSTRSTFAIGHQLEVMAIATLRAIGYPVTGLQQRLRIDPLMSSFGDGIVRLGGENGVAHNLSVKSMGYKMSGKRYGKGGVTWTRHGFAAVVANGVKAEQPGHWAQMQAEMHASGLRTSLYVAVAKDMVKAMEADPVMQNNGSLTFYTELVHYDEAFVTVELLPEWGAAWAITENGGVPRGRYYTAAGTWVTLHPGDPEGNKAKTGTYDPCSYCDFAAACPTFSLAAQLSASIAQKEAQANV